MASFGTVSTQRLATCEPDLQYIFREVVKHFDCSVLCGHRDEAAQTKAFNNRASKVQYPDSRHNSYPSMAVDVAPYPIDWNDLERFRHFGFYVKGVAAVLLERGEIDHSIRWGGDWDSDHDTKDQTFNDLVHFELKRVI